MRETKPYTPTIPRGTFQSGNSSGGTFGRGCIGIGEQWGSATEVHLHVRMAPTCSGGGRVSISTCDKPDTSTISGGFSPFRSSPGWDRRVGLYLNEDA